MRRNKRMDGRVKVVRSGKKGSHRSYVKKMHEKKCAKLLFGTPFAFDVLSGKRDSNSRPQPWQGCALPTELFPQNVKRRRLELPRRN